MTLTLDLEPDQEQQLYTAAQREGISVAEYVRRRVLPLPTDRHVIGKPFNVMQFAGVAPHPVEEIDAHIAEIAVSRKEWDERDWRQIGLTGQSQP